MTTGELKLLPCPFCGGEAIQREHTDKRAYRYGIGCTKCLCENMGYVLKEQAIEAWNTRATLDREKLAELLSHHIYGKKELQYPLADAIIEAERGLR